VHQPLRQLNLQQQPRNRRGACVWDACRVQLFSALAVHAGSHGLLLVFMYPGTCMTQLLCLVCSRMQDPTDQQDNRGCRVAAPRRPSSSACAWCAAACRARTAKCAREHHASTIMPKLHESYHVAFRSAAHCHMQRTCGAVWKRLLVCVSCCACAASAAYQRGSLWPRAFTAMPARSGAADNTN
jgi:hypothetical protein